MLRVLILIAGLLMLSPLGARAETTLRMAHDLGFGAKTTMDPYDPNRFWPTIDMVFDGLADFDPKGLPRPRLATEWSSSVDLKTWTFKLRPGVKFHDGSDFDATDVIYSFKRMIDPEFDSPIRAVLGIIADIKAIDPLTVEFSLSTAEADFPLLTADYRAMITPEGSKDTINVTPIGTGPFKVETLSAEGTTVLAVNPDYFRGRPGVGKIEMIAIPDSAARVQALLAGQIDLLQYLDPKQSALFDNNPEFVLQRIPSGDWNALAVQTNVKPFDDVRIRKALRLAADREDLIKLVLGEGNGVVACDTPVWSGDPYRWEGSCPQDIEGAKKLLAEAGYPDGIDVEIFTSDVEEGMVPIVEVYQAQAKEAGIRVKLTMTAADGFWDNVWMKKPFFVDSWGQRPATQVLNEVYRSGAPWNPTVWTRPDFDALLDKARAEPDFATRKTLYGEAQKMLFEEGGNFIPYHRVLLRVVRSNIKGIESPVVIDNFDWSKISIE